MWLGSSVGRVLAREALGSSPGQATIFSSPVTITFSQCRDKFIIIDTHQPVHFPRLIGSSISQ